MTQSQICAAASLLREHYGDVVEKIGSTLMKHGSLPLGLIMRHSGHAMDQVKKALCVLLTHNYVTFEKNAKGFVMYQINVENVLLIVRYPRYTYCCKTLYGDAAELIAEELLSNGQMLMSEVIEVVTKRLNEAKTSGIPVTTIQQVHGKFVSLVQTRFVQRCSQVVEPAADQPKNPVPTFVQCGEDIFRVPELPADYFSRKRKRSTDCDGGPPAKQLKTDAPDRGSYWRMNYDRFHQLFRDQAIVSAVTFRVDSRAGELMRTLLRLNEVSTDPWSSITSAISKYQLADAATGDVGLKPLEVDQYLAVLVDDASHILNKASDSQGGMYIVDLKESMTNLAWATIETVVQERFGSKCLRILRLLRLKKYLEQKQIEEMAMIPPKDAKDMTYGMSQENFVQVQEIPRTPDYAPARTFFLFHVDLPQVARMLLDRSYRALANLKLRSECEVSENKRLLEKKQKVDAITASLKSQGADEAQLAEIAEMITPPEQAQLDRVKRVIQKLEHCELQLDETIFTLQTYVRYLKV